MNCMCPLPHPPPISSHIWKHPWHSLALVSTPPLYFLIDSGSLCSTQPGHTLEISRLPAGTSHMPTTPATPAISSTLSSKRDGQLQKSVKIPAVPYVFLQLLATSTSWSLIIQVPHAPIPTRCLLQGTSVSSLTNSLSKLSLTFPFPSPPCPSLSAQPCPAPPCPSLPFSSCPGPLSSAYCTFSQGLSLTSAFRYSWHLAHD